jgi:hypothetical protein
MIDNFNHKYKYNVFILHLFNKNIFLYIFCCILQKKIISIF